MLSASDTKTGVEGGDIWGGGGDPPHHIHEDKSTLCKAMRLTWDIFCSSTCFRIFLACFPAFLYQCFVFSSNL